MPRLLLLLPATSYRAEAFLQAAHRLHLSTTIGSEQAKPLFDLHSPEFLVLDFNDAAGSARAAREFAREHGLHAVLGVDDLTAEVAAVIAAALGLPHNPPAAVAAARNKYQMRERLQAEGVLIPRFRLFRVDQDPAAVVGKVMFPCVVKPTILSASCGVIRADDQDSFIRAFRRVAALLKGLALEARGDEAQQILVEEFIDGPELAFEGLLTGGQLRPLALFDKPDPLNGPFFEETIYVTPSVQPQAVQQAIIRSADAAIKALGLLEGPVHGEFRVNERGVWVIEVAARSIGGRCSQTLRFATDMSLEELILRQLLRMEIPSLELTGKAAGVMMLPIPYPGRFREMRGRTEALAVPGIEELTVTVEPGDDLVPLPEGTRYLGFLFARGESPEAVVTALRHAHGRLDVVISAGEGASAESSGPPSRSHVVSF